MADTVETLRAALDKLTKEFTDFKTYAKPVIDNHQPTQRVQLPQHPSLIPVPPRQ